VIASLPMYDWPEIRAATDAWWSGLARALRAAGFAEAPAALTRDQDEMAVWRRPDLLLSQTCSWPLARLLRDDVQVVATPCHAVAGCEGARYSSWIVVREAASLEALAGGVAAVNSPHSLSGCLALRLAFAPHARPGGFFGRVVMTGSHAASLLAVQRREAAVAAVDCVSWAIAARYRPALVAGLRLLGGTPMAPALPYVTSARRGAGELGRLRAALSLALDDPDLGAAREALFIAGAEVLAEGVYDWVEAREAKLQGVEVLPIRKAAMQA
jgi:ABC-type phosphate/phosphonate transport system substrate-binding protein